MVDIDNIVRGIAKLDNNKDLYKDQIGEFCELMCKASFAHKVSKRFDLLLNDPYNFNEFTEDDQPVKPNIDSKHHFMVRMVDNDLYVIVQDYIHIVSEPFNSEVAKLVIEQGIGKLPEHVKY